MSEKSITKNTNIITYQLPQPAIAKYLVVVADRGMTSEVRPFNSFKEAKKAFSKIAYDLGYKPREINASDYYDVSIWEWAENKYEKVYGY